MQSRRLPRSPFCWLPTPPKSASSISHPRPVLPSPIPSAGRKRKTSFSRAPGTGAAIFDYNGDGANDVFIANGTTLDPNAPPTRSQLYRNDGRGHFTEVSQQAGLTRTGWAQAACVGDFDNDGHPDLFVTYYGHNSLYRNLGGGKFADISQPAGLPVTGTRWGSGCGFIDFDGDGYLDIFVANYVDLDLANTPKPGSSQNCEWKGMVVVCGPRGLPMAHNALYHNNRDGTFTDVSEKAGILAPGGRYGLGVVIADFDNDGWPDIYVACDQTPSLLYRNKHDGTFEERGDAAGVAYNADGHLQAGMGIAVGDYDGNGFLDIAKTNFSGDRPSLYKNEDGKFFEDVSEPSGLGRNQLLGWGIAFLDIDEDGWPDLVLANGHVYPEIDRSPIGETYRQKTLLYRNLGNGRFADVTASAGPGFAPARPSRGLATGDLDGDGRPEILIVNMNDRPTLLKNVGSQAERHRHHAVRDAIESQRDRRAVYRRSERPQADRRSGQRRQLLLAERLYAVFRRRQGGSRGSHRGALAGRRNPIVDQRACQPDRTDYRRPQRTGTDAVHRCALEVAALAAARAASRSHVIQKARRVAVQILQRRSPQQRRTHFVSHGAMKAGLRHRLQECAVVDEPFVHGHRLRARRQFFVIHHRWQIPKLGTHGVVRHRRVHRQRPQFLRGLCEIQALQRRSPRVEHCAAVIVIHFANQIVQAVRIHADVMMILYADHDAEGSRTVGGLSQRSDHDVPLLVERHAGLQVAGEHADGRGTQLPGCARQLRHMLDLVFAIRNIRMAKVGSEVRIAGDTDSMHTPLFDALAQAGEFLRPVIQHRKVRTLGHQHHAIEAQVGRVIHEVVKTEDGLSPRSGVAHGMQQEAVDHIGDSVRPGLSLSRATDYDEILEPLNNQTLFRVANTGALGGVPAQALDPATPDPLELPYGAVALPTAAGDSDAVVVFKQPGLHGRTDILLLEIPAALTVVSPITACTNDPRREHAGQSRVRIAMSLLPNDAGALPASYAIVRFALNPETKALLGRVRYTIRPADRGGWFELGDDAFPDSLFVHGFPDIATREQGSAGIRGPSYLVVGLEDGIRSSHFHPHRPRPSGSRGARDL